MKTKETIEANRDRILAKAERKRLGNEEKMPVSDLELLTYKPDWADISKMCKGWRKSTGYEH